MKDKSHQISILGSSFTIKTDEDPEYFRQLTTYVENRINELERTTGLQDPLRLSILSSILIADEFFKAKEKAAGVLTKQDSVEAEKLTVKNIKLLEKYLKLN